MIRAGSCYSSSIGMNKRSTLIEALVITRSGETLFPLFSSPSEAEQSIAPSKWIKIHPQRHRGPEREADKNPQISQITQIRVRRGARAGAKGSLSTNEVR